MIYLDNASTTKPSEPAKLAFLDACDNFGNPSSLHRIGLKAEKIVTSARETVADAIGVSPKTIYFTSGGTESNNIAILGYCRANYKRGNHIITTLVEHPSVISPFEQLKEEGFMVDFVRVDEWGRVDLEHFESLLKDNTILVSIMAANNEVGTIMPVKEIKQIMKEKSKKAVLHVDAVQAFGKIPLKPVEWGVDMMSLSSHKIHGIKGTGALYTRIENIKPIMQGGGQQKGMRQGTENVPGIAAFGAAVKEINTDNSLMLKCRETLKYKLSENIKNISFNGSDEYQTGYVLNVSFKGIKAEILLHTLEDKGIYLSTGSACSSNKPMPSHVLTAMGCPREEIEGAVRISFSEALTDDETETVVREITAAVEQIRKYVR